MGEEEEQAIPEAQREIEGWLEIEANQWNPS